MGIVYGVGGVISGRVLVGVRARMGVVGWGYIGGKISVKESGGDELRNRFLADFARISIL